MKFPSTPILDTFNRADAATLGSDWLPQYFGSGNSLAVVSNTAQQSAGNASSYTVATYGYDVEAWAKLASFGGGELWISLLSSDAGTATYDGYELRVGSTDWSLYRTLNGVTTSIAGGALTNIAGEQFGIRRVGTCVQFWKCGVGGTWEIKRNVADVTYDVATWRLAFFLSSSLASIDEVGGGTCVPVPFPSTGVLDTFNRANGDVARADRWPVSGDPAFGDMKVSSNQLMNKTQYARGNYPWDRPICGENCEMYIDVTDGWNEGPYADLSLTFNQNNSYTWVGYEVYTCTDEYLEVKRRDGTGTTIYTSTLRDLGANGDKWGFRRTRDGCVEVWHYVAASSAWRIECESWDTTYNGPFYLCYYVNGGGAVPIQMFDNLGGGTMPDGHSPLPVLSSRRR